MAVPFFSASRVDGFWTWSVVGDLGARLTRAPWWRSSVDHMIFATYMAHEHLRIQALADTSKNVRNV